MEQSKSFTLGSLFDGIGGFPYAASFLGIKALWASEILPAAVSVTRRHFPDMMQVGDIAQLDGGKLPPVDIITFGSPCQGLSMAGLRLGLADKRSALFGEAIRLIREMQEVTNGRYPKIVLWENVPGALSSAGGSDFRAVLEAFTAAQIPVPRSGHWANAGMVRSGGVDLAWCVYNAQYFGVPQRRRRIFLVADFTGKRAGEILFVPKSLRWYFEAGEAPKQRTADSVENCSASTNTLTDSSSTEPSTTPSKCEPELARTLMARGDSSPCVDRGQNIVTVEHVSCAATGQANAEITENRSPTLVAGHDQPYIAHKQVSIPIHDKATRCNGGGPSRNDDGAGNGLGIGKNGDPAHTITGGDRHAVAAVDCRNLKEVGDLSGTLQAKNAPGYSLNFQNPVRISYVVRRLTPTECERLQGYPDGWTECGHDGKPISDCKRYQMLGNSIAVPCVVYIMEGIIIALTESEQIKR